MKRTGNLSRLFEWIARPRRESCPTAFVDGVQERVVAGWPPTAVGATSTTEMRPGMWVVGELSSPWKPWPMIAMR